MIKHGEEIGTRVLSRNRQKEILDCQRETKKDDVIESDNGTKYRTQVDGG